MAVHISPVRIQRIKERWEREVLHGLARQERRLDRPREALAHILVPRRRDRDDGRPEQLLPFRATPRRDGQLELFTTARRSLRLVRGHSAARQWLLFGRVARRWEQDPERAMRCLPSGVQGHAQTDARGDLAPARSLSGLRSSTLGQSGGGALHQGLELLHGDARFR